MVARTLASGVIAGSKNRFQSLNFFSITILTNKVFDQSLNDHNHSK